MVGAIFDSPEPFAASGVKDTGLDACRCLKSIDWRE